MKDIKFDGDQFNVNALNPKINQGLAGFLVKIGIAKDMQTGNIILLVIFVILISVASFFFLQNRPPRFIPYSEMTEEQKLTIPLEDRMMIEEYNRIYNN
jgi:hypothetical protein